MMKALHTVEEVRHIDESQMTKTVAHPRGPKTVQAQSKVGHTSDQSARQWDKEVGSHCIPFLPKAEVIK